MGGMLAARFAASYPDMTERAILCDPIGLTDVRWQQPWRSAQEAYQGHHGAHPRSGVAGVAMRTSSDISPMPGSLNTNNTSASSTRPR